MKIVVDISEKQYESLKNLLLPSMEERAILNGTVLPKGHGRLGDLDAYLKDTPIRNVDDTWIKESYVYESIINAPTVIEADKEETDGKTNDNS